MKTRVFLLVLSFFALSACGDDGGTQTCTGSNDPEELRGSFCEGSTISFDTVELGWFAAAQTLRIRYGIDEGDRVSPRFEITLIGSQVMLAANLSIALEAPAAFVRRWPEDAAEPQDLTTLLAPSSTIRFDRLTLEPGGDASGRFDILTTNGRTLRGRFSGQLTDLTPQSGG